MTPLAALIILKCLVKNRNNHLKKKCFENAASGRRRGIHVLVTLNGWTSGNQARVLIILIFL